MLFHQFLSTWIECKTLRGTAPKAWTEAGDYFYDINVTVIHAFWMVILELTGHEMKAHHDFGDVALVACLALPWKFSPWNCFNVSYEQVWLNLDGCGVVYSVLSF